MNSQLEYNTKISILFLGKDVTDKDVAEFLSEMGEGSEELYDIKGSLEKGSRLSIEQKKLLSEILKRIIKLFRTHGKKCPGLEKYVKSLRT